MTKEVQLTGPLRDFVAYESLLSEAYDDGRMGMYEELRAKGHIELTARRARAGCVEKHDLTTEEYYERHIGTPPQGAEAVGGACEGQQEGDPSPTAVDR